MGELSVNSNDSKLKTMCLCDFRPAARTLARFVFADCLCFLKLWPKISTVDPTNSTQRIRLLLYRVFHHVESLFSQSASLHPRSSETSTKEMEPVMASNSYSPMPNKNLLLQSYCRVFFVMFQKILESSLKLEHDPPATKTCVQ